MQRLNKSEKIISDIINKNMDVMERTLTFKSCKMTILYIKQLTDRTALSEYVIKPLLNHSDEQNLKAATVLERIIFSDDCMVDTDTNKIEQYILDGNAVLLISGDAEYVVIKLGKVEKRAIPIPENMFTLRGPKDSFIEDLDTNISLIRYRLKNKNLRIERLEVGERTKTPIAVVYFEDIANDTSVSEIKKRISQINTDGLGSSGELQAFLLNKKSNFFPQMGITERSDMACGALLEGKVVVLMGGGPWALIAPKVFSEYLWACDDFYMNKYFGTFARILRVIAFNMAFVVSSLYVAIVSFHNDVLPSSFMIAIAQARSRVPFEVIMKCC